MVIFGRDALLIAGSFAKRALQRPEGSPFFDTTSSATFQITPNLLSKVREGERERKRGQDADPNGAGRITWTRTPTPPQPQPQPHQSNTVLQFAVLTLALSRTLWTAPALEAAFQPLCWLTGATTVASGLTYLVGGGALCVGVGVGGGCAVDGRQRDDGPTPPMRLFLLCRDRGAEAKPQNLGQKEQ